VYTYHVTYLMRKNNYGCSVARADYLYVVSRDKVLFFWVSVKKRVVVGVHNNMLVYMQKPKALREIMAYSIY
jgi:hypothetical protein